MLSTIENMTEKKDKFYYSWREKEVNGFNILSPVRNQFLIGADTCAHHAASAALEMATRRRWAEEGIFEKKKKVLIDIRDLVEKKPPPCSLQSVLRFLQENGGKPTKGNQVFVLDEFEVLTPQSNVGDTSKMLQYLFNKGPFAASFVLRDDFVPFGQEINLCEGKIRRDSETKKVLTHAVAVVGFGIDYNFNPFWEYMETVFPYTCSSKKDGFNRMVMNGIRTACLILD